MNPDICIITINYNSWVDTISLIRSLRDCENECFSLVIVDNNSTDDSVFRLKNFLQLNFNVSKCSDEYLENFSNEKLKVHHFCYSGENNNFEIVFIESPNNCGFGGGNNIGIKLMLKNNNIKYFWILNNDISFKKPHIRIFKNAFSDDKHSKLFLGSKLLYQNHPNKIQLIGGAFNHWFCCATHIGCGLNVNDEKKAYQLTKHIDYPSGACLFFSRYFFEEIGLFDENIFLYFEEMDLVIRAKEKGFFFRVLIDTELYHACGASINQDSKEKSLSKNSLRNLNKSRIYLAKKYFKNKLFLVYLYNISQIIILRLRKCKISFTRNVDEEKH